MKKSEKVVKVVADENKVIDKVAINHPTIKLLINTKRYKMIQMILIKWNFKIQKKVNKKKKKNDQKLSIKIQKKEDIEKIEKVLK